MDVPRQEDGDAPQVQRGEATTAAEGAAAPPVVDSGAGGGAADVRAQTGGPSSASRQQQQNKKKKPATLVHSSTTTGVPGGSSNNSVPPRTPTGGAALSSPLASPASSSRFQTRPVSSLQATPERRRNPSQARSNSTMASNNNNNQNTNRASSIRRPSHARSATTTAASASGGHSDDEDQGDPSFFSSDQGPSLSRRPTGDDLYGAMNPRQQVQSQPNRDMMDDDECKRHDRGEELIRRRMKERKLEKKKQAAAAHAQQQGGSRLSSARPDSAAYSARAPSSVGAGELTEAELSEAEEEASNALAHLGASGGTVRPQSMSRRPTQESAFSARPQQPQSVPQSPALGQQQQQQQQQPQSFFLERTGDQANRAPPHPAAGGRRVSYAVSSTDSQATNESDTRKQAPTDSHSAAGDPPNEADEDEQEGAEGEDNDDNDAELSRAGAFGESADSGEDNSEEDEDVEYTLKDRQDAINIEHPFGLPIWKPALYKKSRSVTRNADANLHQAPSSAAERHLAPGNLIWTLLFGFWLFAICTLLSAILWLVPWGGAKYGRVVFELGIYLFWPFGRYVEGWDQDAIVTTQDGHTQVIPALGGASVAATGNQTAQQPETNQDPTTSEHYGEADAGYDDSDGESLDLEAEGPRGGVRTLLASEQRRDSASSAGHGTIRLRREDDTSPPTSQTPEHRPLLPSTAEEGQDTRVRDYGTNDNSRSASGSTTVQEDSRDNSEQSNLSEATGFRFRALGRLSYWIFFYLIIAPVMLLVCLVCWGLVFTIPMAKLLWVLVLHLDREPLALHFRSAPKYHHIPSGEDDDGEIRPPPPLMAGQFAPRHSAKVYAADRGAGRLVGPKSKIILCIYKAFGSQYYKFTVDGVNIIFINLVPVIFFTIFDDFVIRRTAEDGQLSGLLGFIAGQSTIFVLALASVIPLSYFIGMAVASISAQSSIGTGAVINATFGSIIEIILYSIALSQGKANLVEGSIIGSLIAGVLLMPGGSMIGGSIRRKEQRFNARSAGVTSTMLIMAIIGILTPTLFYEIYGTFQLNCEACPEPVPDSQTIGSCGRCTYVHIDPVDDSFYKSNVRYLSYVCAAFLVMSYLVGLWFSLRTHASQIWQNSQGHHVPSVPPSAIMPQHVLQKQKKNLTDGLHKIANTFGPQHQPHQNHHQQQQQSTPRHSAHEDVRPQSMVSPMPDFSQSKPTTLSQLPPGLSHEDYNRAVELVASASAFHHTAHQNPEQQQHLRRQGSTISNAGHGRDMSSRTAVEMPKEAEEQGGHGGHDAPNWSRTKSYSVLFGCTLLYALISEILVDVVDVVLDGSGIPEKFLGVTLFALVPNTTEFMNAISFALNGNIALSMEIGSAYALQVCLLQIPAMVLVTHIFSLSRDTMLHHAFTLIFPRWDVIAILFSTFLLTYVYLEARANYYRGSILVFSYLVLMSGFYFAPYDRDTEDNPDFTANFATLPATQPMGWMNSVEATLRSFLP